jgi:branched-chain amino acid transport system ATP-binding protein
MTRAFGGLVAVDGVSLDVVPNSIHAVIGTNGAGKSTLLNLVAGEIAPDSGVIYLHGRPITHLSQPQRARAGIGRTYQRNTLFDNFDARTNCSIAAQAGKQRPWAFFERAAACVYANESAERALEVCGLAAHGATLAAALSHGQKRQLEIAMCLAHEPRILLLDEPLAGMGLEESERILELLHLLKKTHAIVLVEHDMNAVFRVADQLTVMVNGRVIASGEPESVRRDPLVITAYLGEEHGHA